jgi:hypothetical protein
MSRKSLLLCALLILLPAPPASAHEGPPFPILVDRRIGPYMTSLWTDPDIGTATVFVVLEPPEGSESLPARTTVKIGVRPISGRLPEVFYTPEPQRVSYGARYLTSVQLDRGEMWRFRVVLDGSEGGGDATAEVMATPNGTLGPIELVLYSMPFLAVGFLWIKAVLRRRASPPAPVSP